MARMTREERAEKANAERRAERVAEFKKKIARERAKRVYSDVAIFEIGRTEGDANLGAMALYELVHEYRRHKAQLRKEIERSISRLTDALARIDVGRNAAWYSNGILGGGAVDLEREEAVVQSLVTSIARLAWATGWWVSEIQPDTENASREKLVAIGVVRAADNEWNVGIGGRWLTRADVGIEGDRPDAANELGDSAVLVYPTEEAAWLAAMVYCGENV